MRTLSRRRAGFTLIELMIVVAIIGILAAIAIPNFIMFQLRSKTAEAKTNLAAIRTAQEGSFAEFGRYMNEGTPWGGNLDSQKHPWTPGSGFEQIGWRPEGEVYYQYVSETDPARTNYSLVALGDLDDDNGPLSVFGYIHPVPGSVAGFNPGYGCSPLGMYSPSGPLLNSVGPCDAVSGQSVF